MSCRLKDYYKEGVPLGESIKIVLELIEQQTDLMNLSLRDYSRQNLIARNLESLGFLEYTHPPSAPEVTVRGGTLVLAGRPYVLSRLKHKSVPLDVARFVLLKAIYDADWECFQQFFAARFMNLPTYITEKKDIMHFIRERYYPHFSERGNMPHWYGLHLSFARQTGVDRFAKGGKEISETLASMDPYAETFGAADFFATALQKPTTSELEVIVERALSIYSENLLGSSSVGYCETLKTVIEALLLDCDLFEAEYKLSRDVISILKKKSVDLVRSSLPSLTEGHGFVDGRRLEPTSYKLFTLL
jgi:hypothetical protein